MAGFTRGGESGGREPPEQDFIGEVGGVVPDWGVVRRAGWSSLQEEFPSLFNCQVGV